MGLPAPFTMRRSASPSKKGDDAIGQFVGALDETSPVPGGAAPSLSQDDQALINWRRYEYIKSRGHSDYTFRAARSENFYFGGSTSLPRDVYNGYAYEYRGDGQWTTTGWNELNDSARPAYTMNEIRPGVNTAIGYQIHNRLDITYRPRGGMADEDLASLQSKVTMQILDMNSYHWKETQLFADGLIEERGYLDIRMNFNKNVFGEVEITVEDPRDIAPDPDSKTYEPEGWADVVTTRWYTTDEIEEHYGKKARDAAEEFIDNEGDWGEGDDSGPRNKIGNRIPTWHVIDAYRDGADGFRRYRIIDRQKWVYELTQVAVYPTGDVEACPNASPEQLQGYVEKAAVIQKRMHKRVRWTVTTRWKTLHDDISPYDRFTIVPFFCYFRRGRTSSMVESAIDSQIILNKAISGFVHIVNTSANSGWVIEQNSLTNMDTKALEAKGSMTGLILEYKVGAKAPVKIEPNAVPMGMDKLIDRAYTGVKNATVPDAMRGTAGQEVSGVAIQSRQFASQQELALPLDNMAHTRALVADFITYLKKTFYDYERVWRITESDPVTGKEIAKDYPTNKWNGETQQFDNDLTVGEYDIVLDTVPMQVTFNNTQLSQALEMREKGVNIPDRFLLKYSNLSDKGDIIAAMEHQPPADPTLQAKAGLLQAQTQLAMQKIKESIAHGTLITNQAMREAVTAMYESIQGAEAAVSLPELAAFADLILKAAGYQPPNPAGQDPNLAAGEPSPGSLPPAGIGIDAIKNHNTGIEFTPGANSHPNLPMPPATGAQGAGAGIEGGQPQ